MKVRVTWDELWPYFFINPNSEDEEVNIPKSKLDWIEATMREFHSVQKYLRRISNYDERDPD